MIYYYYKNDIIYAIPFGILKDSFKPFKFCYPPLEGCKKINRVWLCLISLFKYLILAKLKKIFIFQHNTINIMFVKCSTYEVLKTTFHQDNVTLVHW